MKVFKWIKHRLAHKLEHWKLTKLKETFREHGLALVVIIVGWEIIEDILFPLLFALLGKYVHVSFYAGIPVAWLLCLHWLVVPVTWGWWIKFKEKKKSL
tara:strand:- start:758 stop:1054 length:297 start_codon:yes stop_codon:yes gene_type:complete